MYYWGGTQNTFGIVITHQIRQFKFHFSVDCILHCVFGLEWAQTQPAFYFPLSNVISAAWKTQVMLSLCKAHRAINPQFLRHRMAYSSRNKSPFS